MEQNLAAEAVIRARVEPGIFRELDWKLTHSLSARMAFQHFRLSAGTSHAAIAASLTPRP